MLVYLDTAHLSYLADTTDAETVNRFFEVWDRERCTLAFSSPHLKELAQLNDPHSRERRLALLARFPQIHFTAEVSIELILVEIKAAYSARLQGDRIGADQIRKALFRSSSVAEIRALCDLLIDVVQDLRGLAAGYVEVSEYHRSEREFFDELHKIIRRRPLPEDLPAEALQLAPDVIQAARESEKYPALGILRALYSDVPRQRRRQYPQRLLEEHPVFKFLQMLPDTTPGKRGIPEEDEPLVAMFYRLAAEGLEVEPFEGVQVLTPWSIVKELDPYECPGWNLMLSIWRAKNKGTAKAQLSDPTDAEHAAHFPYVDLAFADKRTHAYLHAESRRSASRLSPAAVAHVVKAADVKAVVAEIQRRGAVGKG
jgi:hypothetical protein